MSGMGQAVEMPTAAVLCVEVTVGIWGYSRIRTESLGAAAFKGRVHSRSSSSSSNISSN
jgi:hypothetical protein